jgi:hypothetical protein
MDARIRLWIKAEELAEDARKVAALTLEACKGQAFPWKVRRAAACDIHPGAIIWYKDGDEGPFFQRVVELYNPSDPIKAFCGHDGSRYGLDGAFVDIGDPTEVQPQEQSPPSPSLPP